jgi:hypothetical protein
VIDASLVLATALQNAKISEDLTTTNTAELSEKGQWLKDLLPKNTEVMHIKRKPKYRKKLESTQIFKEKSPLFFLFFKCYIIPTQHCA